MPTTKQLVFWLSQKEVLNSNSMPSHFIVKGKMVQFLRELAAREGLNAHNDEHQSLIEERLAALKADQDTLTRKTRLKKKLKKDLSLTTEDIDAIVEEQFIGPTALSQVAKSPTLFKHFAMRVTVFPPTRRRLDPPNLYPSVKALADGLTDASWWEDDNFEHFLEISFRYGGLSGEKGRWKLVLDVTEIEDTSDFVTTA